MSKGIDISKHNGIIDWNKAKDSIDFVIMRACYGTNDDAKIVENILGAERVGIPYGLYCFSYALSKSDAIAEADYICDIADRYNPTYPICYDWEYGSDSYARRYGYDITNEQRAEFARAFLNRVEERGYYAMLYSNKDYLNKGFRSLTDKYDLWFAQWGTKEPSVKCGIWQYTESVTVSGVGECDGDISYRDYPSIIASMKKTEQAATEEKTEELEKIKNEYWNKYMKIAKDVIENKYGTNPARRERIHALGYDYNLVQDIVNVII